ncbi:serine/threonine-protein kinase MRCK [Nematocida homosporus]|uniref:serine/threonine-protein kinase MRCK n=1 Tax=Nematocida homosporus TaxID=1912981 RepID=UPI002220490B|nr:serine/threonine-protein kinase MRCK [Nematocida homosporus]KAI5186572.1 serine/threonine-protein kinase MRCK [Nematocida homosporus]
MREKEVVLSREDTDLLLDCARLVGIITGNSDLKRIADSVDRPENYEIIHCLVRGGHSEVFVVRCHSTGQVFALKKVQKMHILSDPLVNPIMRERESMILGRRSEWLLGLHRSFQDETALYFVTDFISGGDLGSVCCKLGVLPEKLVRFYAGEILMALKELHSLGMVHRDIKPENILIRSNGHIMLADFGSAAAMVGSDHGLVVGTPDYVAPELLAMTGESICEKVDVWSLGVVIYELVFGATPFFEETIKKTYERIMRIDFTIGECSAELKDLLLRLLCERSERLSVVQAMDHVFFTGFDFVDKENNAVEYVPEVHARDAVDNFVVDEFEPIVGVAPGALDHLQKFLGFGYAPEVKVRGHSPAGSETCEYVAAAECKEVSAGDLEGLEVAMSKSPSPENLKVDAVVETDGSNVDKEVGTAPSSAEEESVPEPLTSSQNEPLSSSEESRCMHCQSIKPLPVPAELRLAQTEIGEVEVSSGISIEGVEEVEVEIGVEEVEEVVEIEVVEEVEVKVEEEEVELTSPIDGVAEDEKEEVGFENDKIRVVEKEEEVISKEPTQTEEEVRTEILSRVYTGISSRLDVLEQDLMMTQARTASFSLDQLAQGIDHLQISAVQEIERIQQQMRQVEEETLFKTKKIIRQLQTEVRDVQSRIEREVELRAALSQRKADLANENKELKEQIRRLKLGSNVRNFPVKVYMDKKWESCVLYLEEDYIRIQNMKLPLAKIYFQNLKKNELIRMNTKGEALSFKLLLPIEEDLYTEQTESSSDVHLPPAEEAVLKRELEKEIKILSGIEMILMVAADEESKKMAMKQKTGTEKKIQEIRQALEQGSPVGQVDPGVIRYNNHTFKTTTFATSIQVWCHECNRPLYGAAKQGLICKGCRLVCHRDCHTLVEYSCELRQAMEKGTSIILMAKHLEDKERIRALVSTNQN